MYSLHLKAKKYLSSENLKFRQDVISAKANFFDLFEIDSKRALKNFGELFYYVLNDILSQITEPPKVKDKKEYYRIINDPKYNFNDIVIRYIEILIEFEKHFGIESKIKDFNPQVTRSHSINCYMFFLHLLVWKYECFFMRQPKELPPSLLDQELLEEGLKNSFIITKSVIVEVKDKGAGNIEDDFDIWAVSSMKSKIYALSEIVAREAMIKAEYASGSFESKVLNIISFILISLQWNRGYRSILNKLLHSTVEMKKLRSFQFEIVPSEIPNVDGLLSAEVINEHHIKVFLDGKAILTLIGLNSDDVTNILDSINSRGRLGFIEEKHLSLLDHLLDIPVYQDRGGKNNLINIFYENIDILIPLIAKDGFPGIDWLKSPSTDTLSLNVKQPTEVSQTPTPLSRKYPNTDPKNTIIDYFDAFSSLQ